MANENDIGGKVDLDVTNFKANINELNRQIRLIDTGFKAAAAGMDDWSKSEEGLQQRIKSLSDMTDLQRQKVANLTSEYTKVAAEKGENSKAAQDLQVRINKETEALNKNETELRKAQSALDNFGDEVDQADKETGELEGSLGELGSGLANIGGVAAKAAAVGIAAVGAAATAALVGIVKFADDSTKSFNQFQASTGATAEEMEEFREVAQSLYTANLGESMDDVARSMATVKQVTGQAGAELEATTKAALLMRDTFEFDVNESVRTVDTMMKQFGITSEEAYTLMAQTAQQGANRNGDLLDVLNEYAPQFEAMGYSAEEFANTLVKGAESGAFSMDKVGDAIKEFNVRIKDGSDSTYDALADLFAPDDIIEWTDALTAGGAKSAEFMELVGKVGEETATQMVENLQKGGKKASDTFTVLGSIMGDGQNILDGLSTGALSGKDAMEQVIAKLQEIEDPLVRSQLGVALFGTQFEDLEADALLALGSLNDAVDMSADTLKQIQQIKFNDLGSALEGLKRQVLDNLSPVTGAATDMISGIVSGIQNGDWGAVSEALSGGLTNIVDEFAAMLPDLAGMASTIIGTLASSVLASVPEMLPAIIDTALTLLNTLVSTISDNGQMVIKTAVDAITKFISGIADALPMVISAAVDIIMALVESLIENLPEIIDAALKIVIALVDGIIDLLPKLIPAAIDLIVTLAEGIIDALPKLIEKLPEIITTVINVITDNLPRLIVAAVDIILMLVTAIINNLPLLTDAGIEILKAVIKGIISLLTEFPGLAKDIFNSLVTAFKNIEWGQLGKNIISGITEGIKNTAKNLASSVADAAKGALNAAKGFLDIHSPSRVMRDQVGMMIGAGMAEGVEKSAKQVQAAMRDMTEVPAFTVPGVSGELTASGNEPTNTVINLERMLEGMFAGSVINVRSDNDIKQLGQEFGAQIQGIFNTSGVVSV